MSTRAEAVTRELLRNWPLPAAGESKYERGQVIVIGGAARSPGAAQLAGVAALRAGAGRLGLAVGASVAVAVAVALPECGVVALRETPNGAVDGDGLAAAAADLRAADAVLVGPGLDDAGHAAHMLRALPGLVGSDATVVLDAFALGALAEVDLKSFEGRLILTPNKTEAALLLEIEEGDLDLERDIPSLATNFGAVVTCYGVVSDGDRLLTIAEGGPGLGTSGSGDVLSGAITGLAARGAEPLQAATFATWAHAKSGDRLAERVGALGFLAREIADELPAVLNTL